jgi:hypothetical protein
MMDSTPHADRARFQHLERDFLNATGLLGRKPISPVLDPKGLARSLLNVTGLWGVVACCAALKSENRFEEVDRVFWGIVLTSGIVAAMACLILPAMERVVRRSGEQKITRTLVEWLDLKPGSTPKKVEVLGQLLGAGFGIVLGVARGGGYYGTALAGFWGSFAGMFVAVWWWRSQRWSARILASLLHSALWAGIITANIDELPGYVARPMVWAMVGIAVVVFTIGVVVRVVRAVRPRESEAVQGATPSADLRPDM